MASSFAVEVYRALPNDTDFSVLLADGGFTGLNTAYIDGAAAYHTPQDRPERHGPGEPAGDGRQRAGPGPRARRPRPRRRWPSPAPATPPTSRCSTGWSATRAGSSGRWPGRRCSRVAVLGARPAPARGSARCAGRRAPPRSPCCRSCWPRSPRRGCGRCWSLIRPGYARDARPVAAGLVPAGRRRRRRRGRAALVRAAAPPGRRRAARRRARSSGWRCSPPCWPRGARRLVPGRRGRRWPAPSPGIVAALTGNRVVRLGAALVGGAVAVVVLAPTARCSSPRSACATAAVRRLRRGAARRRPAARRSSCCSRTRTSRRGWPSSAVVPGAAVVLAVGLRRRGAVGRPVRRRATRCPASSPTRWTATPGRRGGRAPRTTPGRVHGAVRRRAAAPCPSTSRTWPARRWRTGDAAAGGPAGSAR